MADGLHRALTIVAKCLCWGVACLAVAWRCTSPGALTGTSEQGNARVLASAYASSGKAAAGAAVRLRRADFLSDTSKASRRNSGDLRNVTVNDDGSICMDSLSIGAYALEVNDTIAEATLFRFEISRSDQIVRLGADTLRPYATILGTVDIQSNVGKGYVRVKGLERLGVIDSNGRYAFCDLPAGAFTLQFPQADSAATPGILDDIAVRPGQTIQISYSVWKYSKALYLNTSASGANMAGAVYGFPLLVRLTDSNFVFDQAAPDGGDVRFTKSNGVPLPYEIEQWDAARGCAAVWVKADTVHGNSAAQYIVMHWGNPFAASQSNPAAVFDTAAGFAGVWHLSESGEGVHDATGDAFDGTNSGSVATAGLIGNARIFANGSFIKIPGLINSPSSVTLSAWVRSDTSVTRGQDIISLGDAVLIRLDDVLGMGTAGCYHDTAFVSDTSYAKVNSGRYLAKTGWHYLVFSINTAGHVQTLYIDGVQSAISHDVNPINYAGLGTDTYLGIHGNGKTSFNFIGQIDEARVNNVTVTSDWIKLCYMNQKARDALIQW